MRDQLRPTADNVDAAKLYSIALGRVSSCTSGQNYPTPWSIEGLFSSARVCTLLASSPIKSEWKRFIKSRLPLKRIGRSTVS